METKAFGMPKLPSGDMGQDKVLLYSENGQGR